MKAAEAVAAAPMGGGASKKRQPAAAAVQYLVGAAAAAEDAAASPPAGELEPGMGPEPEPDAPPSRPPGAADRVGWEVQPASSSNARIMRLKANPPLALNANPPLALHPLLRHRTTSRRAWRPSASGCGGGW